MQTNGKLIGKSNSKKKNKKNAADKDKRKLAKWIHNYAIFLFSQARPT